MLHANRRVTHDGTMQGSNTRTGKFPNYSQVALSCRPASQPVVIHASRPSGMAATHLWPKAIPSVLSLTVA